MGAGASSLWPHARLLEKSDEDLERGAPGPEVRRDVEVAREAGFEGTPEAKP